MGLPRKLKNINIYIEGGSYLGEVGEYEEPKLAIATDDWRGGGMIGSIKYDMGIEPMEAMIVLGGHSVRAIRKFGDSNVEGVRYRLVGAYQADDGSRAEAVEIYLGGRFTEIDLGKSKAGDATEQKYKIAVNYYRRVVDSIDEIEINMKDGTFIVGGVDRYGEIMAIISG